MKYLCLAYEEEEKLNVLTQSEWDDLRTKTLEYVDTLRREGYLVETQALQSARTAVTVRVRNGELLTCDGPFAETKEQIGGFFMIEVEDQEEAVRIASQWPSAQIGTIEVRPIEEQLRTDRRY